MSGEMFRGSGSSNAIFTVTGGFMGREATRSGSSLGRGLSVLQLKVLVFPAPFALIFFCNMCLQHTTHFHYFVIIRLNSPATQTQSITIYLDGELP